MSNSYANFAPDFYILGSPEKFDFKKCSQFLFSDGASENVWILAEHADVQKLCSSFLNNVKSVYHVQNSEFQYIQGGLAVRR